MSKKSEREAERKEAIAKLQDMLKPGSRVYTILRHVSNSGMSRDISVVMRGENEEISHITHLVANALDYKVKESHGFWAIRVNGCGMDMGFHLVYNLGRVIFPNGFKPSEAGQAWGRNGTDPNAVDTDGGYALRQEWL